MRVWAYLLVVALLVASCSGAGPGDPAEGGIAGGDRATTVPPTAGGPGLPGVFGRLPPFASDTEDLDWGDFRPLVGRWELVSFTGEDVGPRTIRFDYQRTNETSLWYRVGWTRQCWGGVGTYSISGDTIRIVENGFRTLLITECDTDAELAAREAALGTFLTSATSFSVEGGTLTLVNTEGDRAVFERLAESAPRDSDGLRTIVPRLHFVDESGFMVLVQEQEDGDGAHQTEQVNWVAWEESAVDVGWQTATVESPNSWVWDGPGRDLFAEVEFDIPTERACLLADMNTLHGDNPASLRYQRTESGVELLVDEETSSGPETGHTDELLRAVIVDCFDQPAMLGGVEVGKAAGVTGEWLTVSVTGSFDDPVVVAGPASLNDDGPGVVEVRNVTSSSFEIRFHEWDYLDGVHPAGEEVSFLVAERGATMLPNGAMVRAGTTEASSVIRVVEFSDAFDSTPVLISTVVR